MPAVAPPRTGGTRLAWRIAAGVVIALGVLIAVFDGTWLRPLIQHHVNEKSGRRIDFDRLQLSLDRRFAPTIRLSNLRVENAPWAAPRPLIQAADVSATFDWGSLIHGERVIVTHMRVVDAQIDLEMQADGLRNWRLTRPDDRGPGRIRILTLDAQRSELNLTHRGLDLAMALRTEPLAAPQALPGQATLPLTKTLSVRGKRGTQPFDAGFALSDVISFFDSDRPFALRGQINTPGARFGVQGRAHDLMQLGGFDVDLRVSGSRLDQLGTLYGPLPPLPGLPTEVGVHLSREGRVWRASSLTARVGRSDLSGAIDYVEPDRDAVVGTTGERAQLRGTLASDRLDVAEWRSARDHASGPGSASSAPGVALDARIDWAVATVAGLPMRWPLTGLRTHAAWRDRRLSLDPLVFMLAGGSASGRVTLAEAASSADLRLAGLRLEQLGVPELSGTMNVRASLRSRGASIDAALAALGGSIDAELHGATLPATLDAKLGLDGGRWLRTLIAARDQRRAVLCSALELRIDKGIGTFRRLALETEQVLLTGIGSIDLPHRRMKLSVTPQRKRAALFALDDSIQIDGALSAPAITLAQASGDAPARGGCAGAAIR